MQRLPRSPGKGPSAILMFAFVTSALASAACGGSSSDGEPFADFVGTWKVDTTSSFVLSCPGMNPIVGVKIWGASLVLDPGTVADVVDDSGACTFNYGVKGQIATLSAVDGLTGAAPTCVVEDTTTDATGVDLTDRIQIVPTLGQWSITLQPTEKGSAPKAKLSAAAQWNETLTPQGGTAQSFNCSYVVNADLTKIAKH